MSQYLRVWVLPAMIGVLPAFVACSNSSFSGNSGHAAETKKTEPVKPVSQPTPSAPVAPPASPSLDPKPDDPQISVTNTVEQLIKGPCTVNVAYDPASVQCSLNVGGPNIWTDAEGWKQNTATFIDRSASWISPLAPSNGDSGAFCPQVPSNEKLIYVSSFEAEAGAYSVEGLNDNGGALRLWKNADSAKEALNVQIGATHQSVGVTLEKGHYAVIIDGLDQGVASAIVMAIQHNGQTVKHSVADGSWCIFRVPAGTDVVSYVKQAASCRPCLVGN